MSLLSLCALLFLQSHLFLICVALTCNDSRRIPHKTCQIPRNCQCKWLLVSSLAPELHWALLRFLRSFVFWSRIVTTELPNLAPPRHIDDRYSLRTLWSAVVKSPKFSALGTTVPARLLQEALVIFVFQQISQSGSFEKCVWTLCLPEPSSTFARDSIGNSWEELELSRSLGAGFLRASEGTTFIDQIFSEILQRVWHKSCNRSLCTSSVLHFYFCFRFLLVYAAGFPVAPHSYFHFFLVLDCRCICWHQIRNPVM